jgi:hypothetical protein
MNTQIKGGGGGEVFEIRLLLTIQVTMRVSRARNEWGRQKKNSKTPLIRKLLIRIGLALRVKFVREFYKTHFTLILPVI